MSYNAARRLKRKHREKRWKKAVGFPGHRVAGRAKSAAQTEHATKHTTDPRRASAIADLFPWLRGQ